MKPLCIYHGNCADGFGAAWAVHRKFGDDCDYYPGVYQNEPPEVTGRKVYMVDFSYKSPVVEKMAEQATEIVVLDHHKTAIDDLLPLVAEGKIQAVFDVDHSGAMITWRYFHTEEPPALMFHIEDRDLWRFALPGTREIQAAVFSYPYDFDVWTNLMHRPLEELLKEGKAIERKHFKDISELVEVVTRRFNIGGHDVPIANLPYTLTSDAGHLLAQGEAFGGCYWDTPDGRVFSLRSVDGGLDVSDIAKQYGGGGHKNASGFRVPFGHELTK